MKFEIGQQVVCINDHYRSYCKCPIEKGKVYTVHSYYQCACGSIQITLVEFPVYTMMGCRCPRNSHRRHSYYTWRFKPLEYGHIINAKPKIEKKPAEKEEKEIEICKT